MMFAILDLDTFDCGALINLKRVCKCKSKYVLGAVHVLSSTRLYIKSESEQSDVLVLHAEIFVSAFYQM